MLNIIQNTIGAIRRVGESVVRAGLKMWLPFTTADHLGREVVSDNSFNDTNEWIKESGWTVSDGLATRTNVGSYSALQQHCLVSGTTYQVTIVIDSITSGELFGVRLGTNYIIRDKSSANTYQGIGVANSTLLSIMGEPNFAGTISSISIKEATQISTDSSSNENDAILKTGKALQFTGNDSVDTDFSSSITIKTIAFWIKPTHSSTNEVVFYGGGGQGGTRELRLDHLQLEAINSNISMSTYVNGTLEGVTANGTPAILTQNEWQRVVLTSSTGFTVVSNTFDIGSGLYGHDGRFIMSDLQIYDEAWTTDDIAYDYANPQKFVTDNTSSSISLSNLKGYWAFSEGDGGIAYDSSGGTAYEGTISGATYVDAQERIPQLGMMNWSKGSNLLEYSEDFSEWSNVSSGTGSQVVLTENQLAPDGTLSATKMFFDKGTGSSTTDFSILQTSFSSQSNTASVYLRSDTAQKIMIRNSSTFQLIDVSTDWVRINKTDSGGSIQIGLRSGYVSGEPNTSTIYVWGAQVESGTTASAYRRTNGTTVTDATLISSATDSQKDILGNAVRVKGSGFNLDGTGYAEVLDDASINPTTNISFSCWFYSNSENDKGLLSKWTNGSGYMLYKQTNTLRGYINGTFKTTAVIPQTGWIYACCTFDGSNIKVYTIVPNDLDAQGNQIVNVAVQSYSSTITNSSDELEIGRYNMQSNSQYSDIIDDAQVYDVRLTQSEILQNFNATKSGHNN